MPSTSRGDVPNFLTFDIEDWYHANYSGLDRREFVNLPSRFPFLVDKLIQLCADGGIRSTFFVLACMAEKYPEVIRRISGAGHEVASHGYAHEPVYRQSQKEFQEDLLKSCDILETISGEKVQGYRAPSFSVTADILPWFYDTLGERGLTYSSSVFAGKTFLYGIAGFPDDIHFPQLPEGRASAVLEFPIPSLRILGTTAGVYFRLFPAQFITAVKRKRNAEAKPLMLYLHPREIDPHQHRLPLPFITSLIHYWGVKGCEAKLIRIIKESPEGFTTLREVSQRLQTGCSFAFRPDLRSIDSHSN